MNGFIKNFADIFTFSRASGGGRINALGAFEWVAANQPRIDHKPINLAAGTGPQTISLPKDRVFAVTIIGGGTVAITGAGVDLKYMGPSSGTIRTLPGTGNTDITFTPSGTVTAVHVREVRGILIEEQKTNLLDRGNAVGQAGGTVPVGWGLDQWFGGVNPSFSTNKTNSFGRSASVWSVVGTTSLMNRLLVSPNTAFPGLSVTPGNSYSFGIDMACSAGYGGGITFSFVWYNSSNTILSVSDVPTSGIGQSASRLTGTAVAPANAAALRIRIDFTSMPAIGTNVNFTYEIGAAQIEVGNPSSYIPTSGSQITRAADTLSIGTLSPWLNPAEGTILVESDYLASTTSFTTILSFDNSTGKLYILNGVSSNEKGMAGVGGANVSGAAIGPNSPIRAAVSYSAAGVANSVNGGGVNVNATAVTSSPTSLVGLGQGVFSPLNGHMRKIKWYPKRKVNSLLPSLSA